MFHVSVVELAFTCGIILLLLVVPTMIARMNKRIKDLENKLDKKK
jgi:hypothetical protein